MARIRIFTEKQPKKIDYEGSTLWICQCGLTQNYPFCDGSHARTKGEDDHCLYAYADDGFRQEVRITRLTQTNNHEHHQDAETYQDHTHPR